MTTFQEPRDDSSEYASIELPPVDYVQLPEYFRNKTIESVMPGEVVFPYSGSFESEFTTREVYVNTNREMNEYEVTPIGRPTGQVGLMRVFEEVDGEVIDGYVADFRYVKPTSFTRVQMAATQQDTNFDRDLTKNNVADKSKQPLLAAVFADLDGNPIISGKAEMHDHVRALMEIVDEKHAPRPPIEHTDTKPTMIITPEIAKQAIIGTEYYHG